MKLKHYYFLILIGFMSACAHKTNYYNFENCNKLKLDESKVVLKNFPTHMEMINDSLMAAVNSHKNLSIYNIYTGRNIANLSLQSLNFDSLIKNTYQKKYANEILYNYDSLSDLGISNSNSQIVSFKFDRKKLYIHISVATNVVYLKDSSVLKNFIKISKTEEIAKKYKEMNYTIVEQLEFLIIATIDNNKISSKEILPLYLPKTLKQQNYFLIYYKGFYVDSNYVYVSICKQDDPYETMSSNKKSQPYYLAKINLEDQEKFDLLLTNKQVDFTDFTIDAYYGNQVSFEKKGGDIFFFNGRDVFDITGNKKIFSKSNLKSNEWIGEYYIENDSKIVVVAYNLYHKKKPTEFEKHYAVDSLGVSSIKLFDLETNKWILEKALPNEISNSKAIYNGKIVYMSRDKQNYYLNYIQYNEN